jgi:hypothetical protein
MTLKEFGQKGNNNCLQVSNFIRDPIFTKKIIEYKESSTITLDNVT